ncbi:hypothetical protein GCM10017620_12980 [Brevundimonas intermedia]|uniref:Nuclear transport factor 2 family protein n=1 Tax=Brevundimonas intermedia TaxID=74315 RepID=A0ABQ5T6E6_9CAUL|nr:hypothetical protein [Brevundimonas intermedia]GLK48325.1 hypothetical protein GCM10017620_12980 [Brevundimonas intermedia]
MERHEGLAEYTGRILSRDDEMIRHLTALLSADWSRLSVEHTRAVHTEDGFKGRGWTLKLTPGWALTPGPRGGDWTIERRP